MDEDICGLRSAGLQLLNSEKLQKDAKGLAPAIGWPDGYGVLPRHPFRFPDYLEVPRVLIDKRLGRPLRDLENRQGFWYVSPALKAVLEQFAPGACEFSRCETVLPSGEAGSELWLCSVTRCLYGRDVIDPEATKDFKAREDMNGLLNYGLTPTYSLRFRPEAIGSEHLFRLVEMVSRVFCDQLMKDACKAAGIKGVSFEKIGV
ncbi:DUF1629 domain-containing protein [Methylosinus sp. sav-2]|uniref:imm11 family protein n=1 Tax=Methylosinus sp. sav-2 TaxID=2485168 RepID=UPI00068B7DDA|nr:DUF1629 domain-containing protein [Methylosinus sp. sav-2]